MNTTAEDGEDDAAAKASGERKRSVAVVLVTCEARRSRGGRGGSCTMSATSFSSEPKGFSIMQRYTSSSDLATSAMLRMDLMVSPSDPAVTVSIEYRPREL